MARIVTKDKLESGEIPEVTANEYATLRGCSTHTLDKERCKGNSIPFIKRRNRCWYRASDVLAALEPEEIYTNTSQYKKPKHVTKLERYKDGTKIDGISMGGKYKRKIKI